VEGGGKIYFSLFQFHLSAACTRSVTTTLSNKILSSGTHISYKAHKSQFLNNLMRRHHQNHHCQQSNQWWKRLSTPQVISEHHLSSPVVLVDNITVPEQGSSLWGSAA